MQDKAHCKSYNFYVSEFDVGGLNNFYLFYFLSVKDGIS